MTGNELYVVTQCVHVFPDGFFQCLEAAFGQIGASDRSCKKYIAGDGDLCRSVEENDMARRMTGAVKDFQGFVTDGDFITLIEPAVRCEGLSRRQSPHTGLFRTKLFKQPVIGLVRSFDEMCIRDRRETGVSRDQTRR